MAPWLKWRPWGAMTVRQTLILGTCISMLMPAMVMTWLQMSNRLESEIKVRVQEPMHQYADVLARGVAVALWNLDRGVATELVDAVMRNPDVARITVLDEYQEIFVRRQAGAVVEADVLREERPVHYGGKRVGFLVVEMGSTRVKQEFRTDLVSIAMGLLAQLVASFLFILALVERRMIAPLREVQLGAERIARGVLDQPFVGLAKDEFGRLAQGLDAMRQNLLVLLREREQQTRELERELAERRRTEAALLFSQAKFAAIFHGSPVAMTVSDIYAQLELRDTNAAWEQLFGRQRDTVIGLRGGQLGLWVDPGDRERIIGQLQRSESESGSYEAWMYRGMGDAREQRRVQISGGIVSLEGQSLLILAYEDVTDKRRIEAEVHALNATLEARVRERTQELTDAMQRLQTAQFELVRSEKLSALGSLVAGVAHELNTPIGNSLTVASTMQDQTREFRAQMSQGLTRSKLEQYVSHTQEGTGILMRSLRQAADLVSSFKQVAVDQTSVNRRRFNLHDTIEEILLTLGPSWRKTPHAIYRDIPTDIVLDSYPGPLGQVLTNLINNAMVHAFEGVAKGELRIQAAMLGSDKVRITVCDNGVGIASAHIERVFDPFFTTKLGRGGSGLGLNIAYNLVSDALGGSIRVESEPGKGACFTLVLPLLAPTVQEGVL